MFSCLRRSDRRESDGMGHACIQQDKSRGGHLWPTLLLDSCSRITKRWPVPIFYGMVYAAGVNDSTLYHSHMVNQGKKPKIRRRFVKELALQVIRPWAQKRPVLLTLPILSRRPSKISKITCSLTLLRQRQKQTQWSWVLQWWFRIFNDSTSERHFRIFDRRFPFSAATFGEGVSQVEYPRAGVGKHFLQRAKFKILLLPRAAFSYYTYHICNRFQTLKKCFTWATTKWR